jgi:hypothetical protein
MTGSTIAGRAEAEFVAGESDAADVRRHLILTDQPAGYGGDDLAPSPTELFVTADRVSRPADLPLNRIAGVRSVVKHCTVHGTLLEPPHVDIEPG